MTSAFDAKPEGLQQTIHEYALAKLPEAVRKLKAGLRERTFIDWAKATFNSGVAEGVEMEGFHHRTNGFDPSQFEHMPVILKTQLEKAGFTEQQVAGYLAEMEKQTVAETKQAIRQQALAGAQMLANDAKPVLGEHSAALVAEKGADALEEVILANFMRGAQAR